MPAMLPIVVLTDAERRIARWTGRMRNDACIKAGVKDLKFAADGEQIHIDGFGAELAFCKLINVYPDFNIQPRQGGPDCVWLNHTVDVKTTRYPKGKLIACLRKLDLAADCYALMLMVDDGQYRYVGIARGADLLRPERVTDLGYGDTYGIPQDEVTETRIRLTVFDGQ